jgi:hypothetical protein
MCPLKEKEMPFDPETGLQLPDVPRPSNAPITIQNFQPPASPPPNGGAPALTPELQSWVDARINEAREATRTEEKNKLYPELDSLKGQLQVLAQEREERIANETAAQQQAADAVRLQQEAEMSAKDLLSQQQSTMDQRFAQIEEDRARERALWAKEAEYRSLEDYKARRRAEEADNIIPQFLDFIRGDTQEAIEQSIGDLKLRSDAMLQEIQGAQQPQGGLPPIPRMPVSGQTPVDMMNAGQEQQRSFTPAELSAMSNEEYAALRPQLLGAASQQVRERGLYG